MSRNEKKIAVLGGGPGGYAAAFRAADLGLDVTLIDTDPDPGGTCLYRGCIPSKALLHVARILTEAKEADYWGLKFDAPTIDVDRVREATEEVVQKLTGGLGQIAKARKVKYVQGRGGFIDSHKLRVHYDDRSVDELEFDNVILASGSRPAVPPSLRVESDRVMTSTDALKLESVPKTLLVIGGGYIGLEMATVYQALGSKVTIIELTGALLPGVDVDLVKPVAKRLEGVCESIRLETKVASLEESGKGVRAVIEDAKGETKAETFEKVLISVGRAPNTSGVGLRNTKVTVDGKGFVEVDKQLRTRDPYIYAIGDVAGQPMLAHKATREGRVAAEVIAGQGSGFDVCAIPAVVFTDPEVAWCGTTETEARQSGRDVAVGRFPWTASGRATTLHRNDGLTKIITDAETDEILGVGMVGVGAGELIAEGVLAIEMGATVEDLGLTIHPHPTLSETVMETADVMQGSSTHLYRRTRK